MSTALSRRSLFKAGSSAVVGAALVVEAPVAVAGASDASSREMVSRRWYDLWTAGSRDWAPFDALLTDDFTFTATSGEDRINKAEFKHECWENQIGHIKGFDLTLVAVKGDDVFVKYLCHTTGGQTFRNIELHRVRDGRTRLGRVLFRHERRLPDSGENQKKS